MRNSLNIFSLLVLVITCNVSAFQFRTTSKNKFDLKMLSVESIKYKNNDFLMSDKKIEEKQGFERLIEFLSPRKVEDSIKKRGPPIYEPGSYPTHLIAALAYVVPILDASDFGKYMFEAYPSIGSAYNLVFGPASAIYNGVPFLPFVIYFGMSYICRAPTFPVEVRFHFSQAFIISILQFIPVLLFGLLEKGGVPGMAVLYNTRKFCCSIWFVIS